MAVRGDNSLFFATGIDNSGLLKGKVQAESIIQSLGSTISKINPFAALAVGAIAAFTLIANEGYKMSKAFESAMAEVRTIANVSDKDFEKLEKNVFGIYKRLGTEPPDKLAKGLYEIIGAGFEAGDALNVLEIASKAATAGVTETAVAADGLTTILNAFKLTTGDAQEVADIMFATVDRGKISFEELSSQIATVAPLAASSNISFQEVGAAISTLTKQGVPAGVAMTQIRSAIIATNEVLGDGAFKTLTLQEGFQKMYESAGGSQNKLKEVAGRIEAVNAIIGIAGDNFVGASEDLDAMANSAGSVDRSFKTITSTNANQWEIFGNKIKATTKGIGDAVLDMSTSVVTDLNKIFETNDKLSGAYKVQAEKINELYIEYTSLNVEEKRRLEIIEEIRRINPSVVSGIDDQTKAYDKLGDAVRRFNEFVINKELVDKKFGGEISNEEDALNQYIKNRKEVESNLYEEYSSFISNLPTLGDKYKGELNDILDSEGDRIGKIRKVRELIDKNNSDSNNSSDGVRRVVADDFFSNIEDLDSYKKTIVLLEKQLNKTKESAENFNRSLSDNNSDAPFIIQEINKINSIAELNSKFADYETTSIKKALEQREQYLEKRKEIEGVIKNINSIKTDQYKKDKSILDEYLNSENQLIKEAAEKRKAYFEFVPGEKVPDKDDRTSAEKFIDDLKEKEEQYKHYNLALKNEDDEFAKKLKETYKLKEEDYITYLRNLYKISQSDGSKALILQSLDKQGTGLSPRKKIESISTIKVAPVNLDFKIDTTSINAIKRRLNKLTKDYEKAQTDIERDLVSKKIQAENKKLQAAESHLNKEKGLYGDLSRTINSLSFKELRIHIKNLKERLEHEKLTAKEIIKIKGQIEEAEQGTGSKIEDTANDIAGVFKDVGSLFRKFGDEDTAQLLDQLAGVAEGVGQIGKGIATGNPLDIISGGLQVLESALTVEVVSDTAKFEAAIKELEKAIDKLDYVISKSVGKDKIGNRNQAIKDLEDLEKQADLAYEAEENARKQVKFLGVGLWKKGSGSGTDPAKLEELEQKAEDARRKAQELKEQLDELYTGTTQATIVDSIISGLKEGKRSVADFADDFKTLMQDALLQAFQIKYLEKEIEKFYEAFADAGSDGGYTAEEISALQNLYNSMISGAQEDIDAINSILESSGIGTLGSESQQTGLSGAISTITEDTANVLAGTMNSIRIDISTGLEIAVRNTQYLSQIVTNTSYNKLLEKIDISLSNIDSKL
jgi:TP901 family phage tail tape measure protein